MVIFLTKYAIPTKLITADINNSKGTTSKKLLNMVLKKFISIEKLANKSCIISTSSASIILVLICHASKTKLIKSKIKETNKYAILVTHDVREALSLSKQIHVIGEKPAIIKKSFSHTPSEWEYLNTLEKTIVNEI